MISSGRIEFDQSVLFRKVYSDEFDMPGGEPFSVLLGDYEIHLRTDREHRTNDLEALAGISQVAAAAFAPFIVGAHPSLFGLDEFGELERPMELERDFEHLDYVKWRELRESEDARFLVLTVPRVLRREPYDFEATGHCEFPYREEVCRPGYRSVPLGAGGVCLWWSLAAGLQASRLARGHPGRGTRP